MDTTTDATTDCLTPEEVAALLGGTTTRDSRGVTIARASTGGVTIEATPARDHWLLRATDTATGAHLKATTAACGADGVRALTAALHRDATRQREHTAHQVAVRQAETRRRAPAPHALATLDLLTLQRIAEECGVCVYHRTDVGFSHSRHDDITKARGDLLHDLLAILVHH